MKQKKYVFQVPDDVLSALGLYVPFSFKELEKRDLQNGRRIITLKRESTYQKLYPKLSAFHLLRLRYPIMAEPFSFQEQNMIKVIKKFITKKLKQFLKEGSLHTQGIPFLSQLSGVYTESLHFSFPDNAETVSSRIASCVLKDRKLIQLDVKLPNLDAPLTFFDAIDSNRIVKGGIYHLKGHSDQRIHITDIGALFSHIAMYACLYSIQKENVSPLISDIFLSQKTKCERNGFEPSLASFYDFVSTGIVLPLELLFTEYNLPDNTKCYYFSPGIIEDKLIHIFYQVHNIYQDIACEHEHRQRHQKIATAYITKKNIPAYIDNAMKNSKFLKYFGYVEYDEEVDLEAVSRIEDEFRRLNEQYFLGISFPDVCLRFRKLGKHKASGLYFPGFHTLCVDIRSPSSFIHEYFHMLDDQLGDLSLDVSFVEIVEEYKHAFLDSLPSLDSATVKKLHGNTKYNLRYFFRRAEIFARCGEIYFNRILKVKTSLLEPDLTFAYPKTQHLDDLIQNYYHVLLEEILSTKQAV